MPGVFLCDRGNGSRHLAERLGDRLRNAPWGRQRWCSRTARILRPWRGKRAAARSWSWCSARRTGSTSPTTRSAGR